MIFFACALALVAGTLVGAVLGYVWAARSIPHILASMSEQEIASLARKVSELKVDT
jgi:ribose/xylose/arabinose/galactoside ABC-type transport system permease subunit